MITSMLFHLSRVGMRLCMCKGERSLTPCLCCSAAIAGSRQAAFPCWNSLGLPRTRPALRVASTARLICLDNSSLSFSFDANFTGTIFHEPSKRQLASGVHTRPLACRGRRWCTDCSSASSGWTCWSSCSLLRPRLQVCACLLCVARAAPGGWAADVSTLLVMHAGRGCEGLCDVLVALWFLAKLLLALRVRRGNLASSRLC